MIATVRTLLALLLLTSAALADPFFVEVESVSPGADRARFEASGLDVAGTTPTRVGLIVSAEELKNLRSRGHQVHLRGTGGSYREIEAREVGDIDDPDPGYRTWTEVQNDLYALAAAYPDLATVVDLHDQFSIPATANGQHLLALKISDNVTQQEDEPALLFIGLHHARELNTIEAAFDTAEELLAGYAGDPKIRSWVDRYAVWVVPVVNPDGLVHVWDVEAYWRKNRRNNGGGSYGVDLNRNYPFLWGVCGNVSTWPSSEVYQGPAPASEPETQAMIALADEILPLVVISYHSYGREVLYPYVCATMVEGEKINKGRDLYADAAGYSYRYASASGEDFEWHYNRHNSMAYLIEIGYDFQPPFAQTELEISQYVRPAWRTILGRLPSAPGVYGHVRDASNGQPIVAEIGAAEINFQEGERIHTEAVHGRYHVVLMPGTYTLTFSAAGYQSEVRSVRARPGWAPLNVRLAPD